MSLFNSIFVLISVNDHFLGMLVRALESDWAVLSEDIGFWMPSDMNNREHDDKPEDEEEPGI